MSVLGGTFVRTEPQPFGRPTVYVYRCAKGHEVRERSSSKTGKRWTANCGAILCPQCPNPYEPPAK